MGNNTYSFGRYFECSQQAILMSGYLGSIGYGYPAAMGAWAATQEEDELWIGQDLDQTRSVVGQRLGQSVVQ